MKMKAEGEDLSHKMRKFVGALSRQERLALLDALLEHDKPPFSAKRLMPAQLLQAEMWLYNQLESAKLPSHYNARCRLWLIFMLIRYGGLKLNEIFALTDEDCKFSEAMVLARGKTRTRPTPLPLPAARAMDRIWRSWPGRLSSPRPLSCDASQVRRGLANCAHGCQIDPSMMNASSLRRQRGLELEAEGLHPILAQYFLGTVKVPAPFDIRQSEQLIASHIQREFSMKTSARNVFRGQIISLAEHGILVDVAIEAQGKLAVKSIITQTSRKSLGLETGMAVNALVKAPWVSVLPVSTRAQAGLDNCFEGTVEKLTRDALACEILVTIPQGAQVCALYANGASPSDEICEGSKALVNFSPFAVILTVE